MHISRLRMTNWEVHTNTTIDFAPGLNIIVGVNGAGKSSIMRALAYGVLGELRDDKEAYITHGTKHGHVQVLFSLQGHDLHVERHMAPAKQILTVGDRKYTRQAEITDQIESLIGSTTDALLNNVFIGQGEIDKIFSSTDGERKKEFQRTFGLQRMEEAYKILGSELNKFDIDNNLGQRLKDAKAALALVEADLAMQLEQIKVIDAELDGLRAVETAYYQGQQARANAASHTQLQRQLQEQIVETQKSLSDLGHLKVELHRLQAQEEQLKPVAQAAASQLEAYRSAQSTRKLQSQLQAQLNDIVIPEEPSGADELDRSMNTLVIRKAEVQRELRAPVNEELQSLLKQVAELERPLPEWRAPDECLALQHQIDHLTVDLANLSSGVCPTCHQDVATFDPAEEQRKLEQLKAKQLYVAKASKDEYDVKRVERTNSLRTAEIAVTQLTSKLKVQLQAALADVDAQLLSMAGQLNKLKAAKIAYDQAYNKAQQLRSQLEQLQVDDIVLTDLQCEQFQQMISIASNLGLQIAGTNAKIQQMQQQHAQNVAKTQQQHQALQQLSTEQYIPTDAEMDDLRQQMEIVSARTQLRRTMVDQSIVQEVRATANRQVVADFEAAHLKQERDVEWCRRCTKVRAVFHSSGLPSIMMKEYAQTLNKRIAYYQQVWEAPFRLELNDQLQFVAHFPNGVKHDAKRLSGGQKIMGSTSFRLAMVDTFAANSQLLVLDEPSVYLDKDNIVYLQHVLMKLKELSGNTGRQIVMVTHEEQLTAFADHVIRIHSPNG